VSGAFLTSFRYAPRFEPIGIESRWRPPDLDQMPENPPEFVGILNDGDDIRVVPQDEVRGTIPTFHIPAALWAHHRINLVDLCEKPGTGTLARIDGDFLVTIPQGYIAQAFCVSGMLMSGLPTVRRSLRNPGHVLPPSLRAGSIEPVAPDELQAFRRNVLGELGEEVEGIKHVKVLLEVLRVFRVEQHPSP